jgi:hypothetical protein
MLLAYPAHGVKAHILLQNEFPAWVTALITNYPARFTDMTAHCYAKLFQDLRLQYAKTNLRTSGTHLQYAKCNLWYSYAKLSFASGTQVSEEPLGFRV